MAAISAPSTHETSAIRIPGITPVDFDPLLAGAIGDLPPELAGVAHSSPPSA
jgi:hypothetical protein